jgi:phosphoglycerol transferase MdoB-like AlkP superfamily enzyme
MQILKELLKHYLILITIFFTGRLGLFVLYFDRFKDSDNFWMTFLYGLRMDTIATSILLVIPLLVMSFTPNMVKGFADKFLRYYFLSVILIAIYIESATFPFFAEYDVRPNYKFVEYLEYPKEVFSMIIADYPFELIFTFLLMVIAGYLYIKEFKPTFLKVFNLPYLKRVALFLPFGLLIFLGIRSSFGHRPANITDAMFSKNRVINEITKNSLHSIGYAVYANKKYSTDVKKLYGEMQMQEALKRVKKRLNINSNSSTSPLSRVEKTHFKTKNPKNLVIFLQESLGYQFYKDKNITPNLNRLSHEGIFFTNLYSNGTRSIRGIAGMVSGNFSIPGKGVLKRNLSQEGFFTISSLLKPLGYKTSFFYGGESRFDNMKGWFLGNGFDLIFDQEKFKNPKFVGTWGVCDEEVEAKANEYYKNLYKNGTKFASIIFSTTNHTPFDFPDNKIELLKNVKKKSVQNAVKYADFAIGDFIKRAKKEPYYKDTIFVIVADHNIRVYGDDVVPVNMFQIPALILADKLEPKFYDKLSTQPDLLATAIDLMGIDATYPIMGHSIFSDKKQELSLMQFNNFYALRVKDKVAVIRPKKRPLTFIYKDKHLIETKEDRELEKDALAFILVLNHLYQNRLYK